MINITLRYTLKFNVFVVDAAPLLFLNTLRLATNTIYIYIYKLYNITNTWIAIQKNAIMFVYKRSSFLFIQQNDNPIGEERLFNIKVVYTKTSFVKKWVR